MRTFQIFRILCMGSGLLISAATTTEAVARTGEPGGEVGTVDTVAGPGFCEGSATVDPASVTVRALAVERTGVVHFDTGPPSEGLVGRADAEGGVRLLRTGIAEGPDPSKPQPPGNDQVSSASRLAADGTGGVLMAAGAKLVQLGVGLTSIAGDGNAPPNTPGPGSSGDGGPALQAKFRAIKSLASDQAGNAYVADEIDAGMETVRIRFVNRSPRPVIFYSGTAQELTVAPGHIDTIAGAPEQASIGQTGSARQAHFAGVPPVMAAAGDRLYIASFRPGPASSRPTAQVEMVNLGGAAVTVHGVSVGPGAMAIVAGGGQAGYGGDGGPA